MSYFHVPALLITVGGTLLSVLVQFSLRGVSVAMHNLWTAFSQPLPSASDVLSRLRSYAILARKEGIRQLEAEITREPDTFLQFGLELVTSEADPEALRSALDRERCVADQKHRTARRLFEVLSAASPAWGLIGTLMALIQMFSQLDDARLIGPGLALALTTTLYGVLLANLIFTPIAGRLETRHAEDMQIRQMIQEGLMAMNEEYSPKLIEERLRAWLPTRSATSETSAGRRTDADSARAA